MFRNKKYALSIAIIILLAGVIASCGGGATEVVVVAEPTSAPPTLAPTPVPPTPAPQEVVVVDMWPQVQQEGVLTIGTSSGYPPFEFIDAQTFELDGFDIALINEVGRRLGLQVLKRDMAFAGLGNALQLREINAAIAAISVTEQRLALFDFTNVYYVSSDGILARETAQVVINIVEDLAPYKLGVQTGSVYAAWLQESLVDRGLMPPENLVRFDTTEEMIQALVSQPPVADLLVLDLLPAEEYADNSALGVVAQGLNQQVYAIAIPKGELTLQKILNDTLLEMQLDGTIAALASQYLGLQPEQLQPIPTPAPAPVVTPLPPVSCLDSMVWEGDITYDDNIPASWPIVGPGEAIQKGWRIKNTGSCTWDQNYSLIYDGSQPPGVLQGGPTFIQGTVPPGATYDIYVDVVVPDQPGQYVGYYTMQNPGGALFGDRIWVAVQVGGSLPTPGAGAPLIERYSVEPPVIQVGACVEVDWIVSGEISNIQILANGQVIMAEAPPIGAFDHCPESAGSVAYELVAAGPGGTTVELREIEVGP
jgi:polar amino acid transport system substrate-binding protein